MSKRCEICGNICAKVILCPSCGHKHAHLGCKVCECNICPLCNHVYGGAHHPEPHPESHMHHRGIRGKK
jgi:hypothetical protein